MPFPTLRVFEPAAPSILLQTVIIRGHRTNEGTFIEAVALPWFTIIALLNNDPDIAYQLPPEKWEEIIAGVYKQAGFDEVILTPRSGDLGRDVIATKKGVCSIRVIDQVKAYRPPHLVTANDVRALMGVLQTDGASKGCLTTTSDFAPKIRTDPLIVPFIRIGHRRRRAPTPPPIPPPVSSASTRGRRWAWLQPRWREAKAPEA